MLGGTGTVKLAPLLAPPPTVTTTLPEVAPAGTLIVMLVALQEEAVPADVPLKVTVLVPCEAPKFVPAIVTGVPTAPEFGVSEEIVGAVELLLMGDELHPASRITATREILRAQNTRLRGAGKTRIDKSSVRFFKLALLYLPDWERRKADSRETEVVRSHHGRGSRPTFGSYMKACL